MKIVHVIIVVISMFVTLRAQQPVPSSAVSIAPTSTTTSTSTQTSSNVTATDDIPARNAAKINDWTENVKNFYTSVQAKVAANPALKSKAKDLIAKQLTVTQKFQDELKKRGLNDQFPLYEITSLHDATADIVGGNITQTQDISEVTSPAEEDLPGTETDETGLLDTEADAEEDLSGTDESDLLGIEIGTEEGETEDMGRLPEEEA